MHHTNITGKDPFGSDRLSDPPKQVDFSISHNSDFSGMAFVSWIGRRDPTPVANSHFQCTPLAQCPKCDWHMVITDENAMELCCQKCAPAIVKLETGKLWSIECAIPGVILMNVNRSTIIYELISKLENEFK
ncbi:hypothetical protein LCGC14_1797040 [marine sediment metagenome]|uniref:Uncharacterized protein n=1 Tax=marine sediment metagenome TaxID=412755 RepID=A0A0F9GQS1_9ZZZZ